MNLRSLRAALATRQSLLAWSPRWAGENCDIGYPRSVIDGSMPGASARLASLQHVLRPEAGDRMDAFRDPAPRASRRHAFFELIAINSTSLASACHAARPGQVSRGLGRSIEGRCVSVTNGVPRRDGAGARQGPARRSRNAPTATRLAWRLFRSLTGSVAAADLRKSH